MDKNSKLPLYLHEATQNMSISATLAMNELIAEKEIDEKQRVLHIGFGEAFLWDILHNVTKKDFKPELPILTFAQERWTKVIINLNEKTKQ